jgi:2-polyprenyl-3-methyl-5-hydroxy-6-metoxy-1,4-benzoquinol methylase
VLDVGCGSGLLLLMMASLDKISDGHGFDISEKAISVAQRAAEANKLGDRLTFESRGAGMALPEGNWSVVTLVDVLHHVPRAIQKSFFLSVCESVPDGGRLIVKDMVDRPRWRALANGAHDLVLARDVVNHVSAKEVSEWGASAGLETIHKGSRNTLWYGHWSLAFARGGA